MGGKIPSEPPTPTGPSPTTLPRFPPQHMWIDNKKKNKVFLASLCQGLPGGIGLFRGSPLSLACQLHILPAATEELRGGRLSDTIQRVKKKKKKAGPQLKPSEYTDCGDPFHLIIAPFELFNTNAEWLVVASGGGVSGISEGR